MGASESEPEKIDADQFFASLDVTPSYLSNIKKPEITTMLKKCCLSFAVQENNYQVTYRGQVFSFPSFQVQEIFTEFDKLDKDGTGKISFQIYISITNAKFPHIDPHILINIYEYIEKDETKKTINDEKKSFQERLDNRTNIKLNKITYAAIMYILHHFNLIKYEPIVSLFLTIDHQFDYHCNVQDLLNILYQHYGLNNSDALHLLDINASKQFGKINVKNFLKRVPIILRNEKCRENNSFQLTIDVPDNCSEASNFKENISFKDFRDLKSNDSLNKSDMILYENDIANKSLSVKQLSSKEIINCE